MIPSAVRASCVCSLEIWSMANSKSVLIAARSMRSGPGRGGVRRYSSGMRTVCQMMVAPRLTRRMRCSVERPDETCGGPRGTGNRPRAGTCEKSASFCGSHRLSHARAGFAIRSDPGRHSASNRNTLCPIATTMSARRRWIRPVGPPASSVPIGSRDRRASPEPAAPCPCSRWGYH